LAERYKLASLSAEKFGFTTIPVLVDPMDNNVNKTFAAWPERLYVIEKGKIAYKGGPGPFGYDIDSLEAWLSKNVK